MTKKYFACLLMASALLALTACGLKRNLELPDAKKGQSAPQVGQAVPAPAPAPTSTPVPAPAPTPAPTLAPAPNPMPPAPPL